MLAHWSETDRRCCLRCCCCSCYWRRVSIRFVDIANSVNLGTVSNYTRYGLSLALRYASTARCELQINEQEAIAEGLRSRSLAIMPFDRLYMISYLSSIVTMSLSCTVSKILSLISQNLKTSLLSKIGSVDHEIALLNLKKEMEGKKYIARSAT